MDMKIDAARIRAAREQRAWSQQHLADAAGLGLRTVQRIESTGAASYESTQAIAACLEIDIADLRAKPAARHKPWLGPGRRGKLYTIAASLLTVMAATLVVQRAAAEQIVVDLGVTKVKNMDTHELVTAVQLENGKPYALEMHDAFRFSISATKTPSQQILIAVELFDFDGKDYVLLSEPRLLTEDGHQAVIQIGTKGQGVAQNFIEMLITPHLQ